MSKSIPGLNDLANRLKDIHFHDEFDLLGRTVHERAASGDIHNCYPRTGSHGVEVRFYLGGTARCIGFTDDPTAAARFADLARIRFQRYRRRGSNIIFTDQDMNLNLDQVGIDGEEVPEAVALLDDIEHLLLAAGVIQEPGTEQKCMPWVPRKPRSTQKGELLATLKEINTTQNHIYELLARVELRLNALQPREMGGSQRRSGCEGD